VILAPASRSAACAALLWLAAFQVLAQPAADRPGPALDKPPHPLVPLLKFGFFSRPADSVRRGAPLAPSADPRDFSGRYVPREATLLLPGEQGRMASYTDRGARTFLARAQDQLAGRPRADPLLQCKPEGAVRALNQGYTVQVLQSAAGLVVVHMENHLVRRIRIGGTVAAAAPARLTLVGTSAARWEGNTLVVETRGIRDGAWLDDYGDPGSDKMMLTERYTKQPNGSLRIEATINDPANYSEPIRMVRNWTWAPDAVWRESICEAGGRHVQAGQP
jgi:hypothetical protein